MSKGEIKAVDYHRNGVAGNGFLVAIVEEEGSRKLIITFPNDPASTAVLDLDMAAAGNIFMHPRVDEDGVVIPGTGGNAWRGDHYAGGYLPAIVEEREKRFEEQVNRYRIRRAQEA